MKVKVLSPSPSSRSARWPPADEVQVICQHFTAFTLKLLTTSKSDILQAVDLAALVFLDLSSVLDTVDHSILTLMLLNTEVVFVLPEARCACAAVSPCQLIRVWYVTSHMGSVLRPVLFVLYCGLHQATTCCRTCTPTTLNCTDHVDRQVLTYLKVSECAEAATGCDPPGSHLIHTALKSYSVRQIAVSIITTLSTADFGG